MYEKTWSAVDLANAVLLLGLPFLAAEAAIYHPGENGQVKNKCQVLLEAPPLCTWCGWSGLSPARGVIAAGRWAPSRHPTQQPQPASPSRDGGLCWARLVPCKPQFAHSPGHGCHVWRSKLKRLQKCFWRFTEKPFLERTQGDYCDLYCTRQELI